MTTPIDQEPVVKTIVANTEGRTSQGLRLVEQAVRVLVNATPPFAKWPPGVELLLTPTHSGVRVRYDIKVRDPNSLVIFHDSDVEYLENLVEILIADEYTVRLGTTGISRSFRFEKRFLFTIEDFWAANDSAETLIDPDFAVPVSVTHKICMLPEAGNPYVDPWYTVKQTHLMSFDTKLVWRPTSAHKHHGIDYIPLCGDMGHESSISGALFSMQRHFSYILATELARSLPAVSELSKEVFSRVIPDVNDNLFSRKFVSSLDTENLQIRIPTKLMDYGGQCFDREDLDRLAAMPVSMSKPNCTMFIHNAKDRIWREEKLDDLRDYALIQEKISSMLNEEGSA